MPETKESLAQKIADALKRAGHVAEGSAGAAGAVAAEIAFAALQGANR